MWNICRFIQATGFCLFLVNLCRNFHISEIRIRIRVVVQMPRVEFHPNPRAYPNLIYLYTLPAFWSKLSLPRLQIEVMCGLCGLFSPVSIELNGYRTQPSPSRYPQPQFYKFFSPQWKTWFVIRTKLFFSPCVGGRIRNK